MRGRPFPGLPEMEDAALSAMCGGDGEPMALIRRRLIVGERMGKKGDSGGITISLDQNL